MDSVGIVKLSEFDQTLGHTRIHNSLIVSHSGYGPEGEKQPNLAYVDNTLPNVRMLGFVDQFQSLLHDQVLEKSWILVNTAEREGLPNAFLEAAARGGGILSSNDPDSIASKFGEHVVDDDFSGGLERLLAGNRWRSLGDAARAYVSSTFASDLAIARHLEAYNQVLAQN